ncbi:hypothetical protein ACIO3O_40105 [Streptomyces sp. NPDC087440]|uniref:hypothetical protein n=1 Tax=Streptomyces sp. NPDC087440 TaxID=3365790 RepID=UPI0037FC9364
MTSRNTTAQPPAPTAPQPGPAPAPTLSPRLTTASPATGPSELRHALFVGAARGTGSVLTSRALTWLLDRIAVTPVIGRIVEWISPSD